MIFFPFRFISFYFSCYQTTNMFTPRQTGNNWAVQWSMYIFVLFWIVRRRATSYDPIDSECCVAYCLHCVPVESHAGYLKPLHWDYNTHYSQHYHGNNRREAGKYFYTILFNIWKSLFARTLSANSNLFTGKMHKWEGQRNSPGGGGKTHKGEGQRNSQGEGRRKAQGSYEKIPKGGMEKCSKKFVTLQTE